MKAYPLFANIYCYCWLDLGACSLKRCLSHFQRPPISVVLTLYSLRGRHLFSPLSGRAQGHHHLWWDIAILPAIPEGIHGVLWLEVAGSETIWEHHTWPWSSVSKVKWIRARHWLQFRRFCLQKLTGLIPGTLSTHTLWVWAWTPPGILVDDIFMYCLLIGYRENILSIFCLIWSWKNSMIWFWKVRIIVKYYGIC